MTDFAVPALADFPDALAGAVVVGVVIGVFFVLVTLFYGRRTL